MSRPRLEVADIFREHGPAWRDANRGHVSLDQLKVMSAVERCRTPVGHVMRHWRGVSPAREAWRLGLAHGVFCVGCCWALMLIMFVVGTGNLGWMLLLGLAMAAEKNFRWGARLSAPLGAGLLAWSAGVVALHLA